MNQHAVLKVKEHFDQVNALWQSKPAKEWQARLACEAAVMEIMGLSYDQDGNPPKNMYIVTTKVLDYMLSKNSEMIIGPDAAEDAWNDWLGECRGVITEIIAENKDEIDFNFVEGTNPDQALIIERVKTARRLIHESQNPVENPALTALVKGYELSDAYKECFRNITRQYLQALLRSNDFAMTMKVWPHMKDDQQEEWLQRQVNLLAEIQKKNSGLDIGGTAVKWYTKLGAIAVLDVHLDEETSCHDEIRLSSEDQYNLHRRLSYALDAAVHEQYHQFHNALARAARYGLIDRDHPLYEDAVYFDALWKRDGYIAFGEAYLNQVDERYAINFSDTVGMFVWELQEQLSGRAIFSVPGSAQSVVPSRTNTGLQPLAMS